MSKDISTEYTKERNKKCGRCVHDGEGDPNIVGSTCYLCKRNPDDHRIDWFEEKKEDKATCKVCGGTGFVPIGPGVRGIKRCDVCHGTGEVNIK